MRRILSIRSISAALLIALLLSTSILVPSGKVSAGDNDPTPPSVYPDTTKPGPTCVIEDPSLPVLDLVLIVLSVL